MHSLTSIRRVALGVAVAGVTLGAVPALSSAALPRSCVKGGVCFTKSFPKPGFTKLTVTGTSGDDTIVLAHVRPFSNNTPSGSVSVNGKDAHVNEGDGLTLVVNGLAGNDQITEQFPSSTSALYGTSTIDGGAGDDTIAASFRADVLIGGPGADVLDGGAGDDQFLAVDGQADALHGGLGTDTAQRDAVDAIDGVETDTPQVGRARLEAKTVRARAGKTTELGVIWTHPKSWRQLKMVALKAFDGDKPVGEVYVPMHGAASGSGALRLVSSQLTRRGRTAHTKLAVRIPRSLAGKTLRLDVEAADRDGHLQLVSGAGVLKVAR